MKEVGNLPVIFDWDALQKMSTVIFWGRLKLPGLVNIQKTMENHHDSWENSPYLWTIFNSELLNYQRVTSWTFSGTEYALELWVVHGEVCHVPGRFIESH